MRRIGVVVNPIAGMGGRVGLKGTDGKVEQARARGATPRAPDRARDALQAVSETDTTVEIVAAPAQMGEDAARDTGFNPETVDVPSGGTGTTSAADTRAAVRAFAECDVDIVLFTGGDGTAVDVAETLSKLDDDTPMLGVPAGVKVYSAVFAVSPRAAGVVAATFEQTTRAEVNDIDEDDYREGEVRTELRAIATVPVAEQRQSSKQLASGSVGGIADGFVDEIERGVTYVLGPGSTVGEIKSELDIDGSPLGVDVWRDGELLAHDAAESDILDALGDENVIVVSPIGGQGFVFGRGNQQISPAVIEQSSVEIVASRRKLDDIGVLRADTGDEQLDERLRGWHQVRVGRFERRLVELV
jgi:NAD+ kinase